MHLEVCIIENDRDVFVRLISLAIANNGISRVCSNAYLYFSDKAKDRSEASYFDRSRSDIRLKFNSSRNERFARSCGHTGT